MTITIHLTPDLERKLREESAAQGVPAEDVVVGALSQSLGQTKTQPRLPSRLSAEESRLLMAINVGLSEPEWQRFHELQAKRRAETLTKPEQRELIAINDRLEALNVRRLEKLMELGKLWGMSLDQVMHQLGIRRPDFE